jgi:hypothetical protein
MILMPNPYDPQTPARPEYFGGREHILEKLRERIAMAGQHGKSGGILIWGHRCVGKTSLITKITSEVRGTPNSPSNVLIITRRLARTTNDQELYTMLNEEMIEQVEKRQNVVNKIKGLAGNISGLNAFSLGVALNKTETEKSPYHKWRSYVENLENAELILIAIDDADWLSIEAIGELKTIVEEVSGIPVLLIISGFIDFEEKLVNQYSPVARVFSGASFNIGRFSLDETKEVLMKPLVGEKTSWNNGAIKVLQKVSGGYPYLVQCVASASYSEGETITEGRVKEKTTAAVNIGRSWLDHEIPEASNQDVISFAKITKLDKDIISSTEISDAGVSPPYIGRLVKLGVLKQVRRGTYSIEKSPMIATFELLKRKLPYE